MQGRRQVLGIVGGGGVRQSPAKCLGITLTFQKDTISYISVSVISNIHGAMSLFSLILYTGLYVVIFKSFLSWQNIGGVPPPPPPPLPLVHTAMVCHVCSW